MEWKQLIFFLQEIDNLIVECLIVLGQLIYLGNEKVENLFRIVDLIDVKDLLFSLVGHIMRSQPITFEPYWINELCKYFFIMDIFYLSWNQGIIPLLSIDISPNAIKKSRFMFSLVQISMKVWQNLRNLIE